MSPLSGPTSGRQLHPGTSITTADGRAVDLSDPALSDPVVMTLWGEDLGESGTVRFVPVGSTAWTVPSASILSWNHTTVQF